MLKQQKHLVVSKILANFAISKIRKQNINNLKIKHYGKDN